MKYFLPLLLLSLCSLGIVRAKDYTLINQLPQQVTTAKAQSAAGWDSGVTSKMNQATYDYNTALTAIIRSLVGAYYPKEFFAKDEITNYMQALYTVRRFKQNIANPADEDHGTAALLDVPNEVSTDLESTISDMVKAIGADDPKFNYADWKTRWEQVVKQ